MPIHLREFTNEEVYHIIHRGIDDRRIFEDENDYYRGIFSLYEFNNVNPVVIRERRQERMRLKQDLRNSREVVSVILEKMAQEEAQRRDLLVEILAFCFMPNHIHLLLKQLKDNGISLFMNKFGGYAYYFNQRHKRKGHLFQDRFKDVRIEDDEHLKTEFVYVHTNPASLVEPGWKEKGIKDIDRTIEFLENYKWSSFGDYIGKPHFPSLTNRDFLAEVMDGPDSCRKFVSSWLEYKKELINPEGL